MKMNKKVWAALAGLAMAAALFTALGDAEAALGDAAQIVITSSATPDNYQPITKHVTDHTYDREFKALCANTLIDIPKSDIYTFATLYAADPNCTKTYYKKGTSASLTLFFRD